MFHKKNVNVYNLIMNAVESLDFETEELDNGIIIDSLLIRKLYRTLLQPMPTYVTQDKKGENVTVQWNKNIIQWHLDQNNTVHLELTLRLIVMNSNCNLANVVSSISEFQKLFSISSPAVNEFLRNSFISSAACRELNNMKWDSRMSQQVFGTNTSMLNEAQITHLLAKANERTQKKNAKKFEKTRRVTVRMLDIEWLSENFGGLYTTLANSTNDGLFRNELIKILISQQSYTNQILLKVFIPYVIFWIAVMSFFSYYMTEATHGDFWTDTTTLAVRLIIILGSVVFGIGELIQIYTLKFEYFLNKWNWLEFVSSSTNMFLVLEHGFKIFGVDL